MPRNGRPATAGSFKAGDPRAGRPRGVVNKRTLECKTILEAAVKGKGGVKGLLEWVNRCNENETIFWSIMFMKLLPVHIQGQVDTSLTVNVTGEELAKQLEERGLPPVVFGRRVPQIDRKVGEIIDAVIEDEIGDK